MRGSIADVVNSPLWANQCGENARARWCWSKGLESKYNVQGDDRVVMATEAILDYISTLGPWIGVLEAEKLAEWGLKM